MPLYDYRCQKCGETFEAKQKFSDAPLTVHQDCGGELERLLSAPALQFKGSGWYVTDYANKHTSSSKSSNGNGTGAGEKKSEPKAETPKTSSSTEK